MTAPEIYAAFRAGRSMQQLAAEAGMSVSGVEQIIRERLMAGMRGGWEAGMTNPEGDLTRLKNRLRTMAVKNKMNVSTWWTVNGYANIIERAIAQIKNHEAEAGRVYGEAAPLFAACGEESPTEKLFGPLCRHCAKPHMNCDCDDDSGFKPSDAPAAPDPAPRSPRH